MPAWAINSSNTDPSVIKQLPNEFTIGPLASLFGNIEVRESAGRGIGLFATVPFSKGDEILVDEAFLWQMGLSGTNAPVIPSKHMSGGEDLITAFLYQFSPYCLRPNSDLSNFKRPKDRRELLKEVMDHNSSGVGPLDDNSTFGVFSQRSGARALFPMVAALNHSCDPNVMMHQAEPIEFSANQPPRYVICARKNIAAGEELLVSYVPITWHKHIRQKALQDRWHFVCTCSRCTAEYDDTIITRCPACTVPATEDSYSRSGRIYWKASKCADCHAPANVQGTPAERADNDMEMLAQVYAGARPGELVKLLLDHPILSPSDTRIIFTGLNLLGMLAPAPALQEKLREGLRRGIENTPYATLMDFNLEREPAPQASEDPDTSEPTLPAP